MVTVLSQPFPSGSVPTLTENDAYMIPSPLNQTPATQAPTPHSRTRLRGQSRRIEPMRAVPDTRARREVVATRKTRTKAPPAPVLGRCLGWPPNFRDDPSSDREHRHGFTPGKER